MAVGRPVLPTLVLALAILGAATTAGWYQASAATTEARQHLTGLLDHQAALQDQVKATREANVEARQANRATAGYALQGIGSYLNASWAAVGSPTETTNALPRIQEALALARELLPGGVDLPPTAGTTLQHAADALAVLANVSETGLEDPAVAHAQAQALGQPLWVLGHDLRNGTPPAARLAADLLAVDAGALQARERLTPAVTNASDILEVRWNGTRAVDVRLAGPVARDPGSRVQLTIVCGVLQGLGGPVTAMTLDRCVTSAPSAFFSAWPATNRTVLDRANGTFRLDLPNVTADQGVVVVTETYVAGTTTSDVCVLPRDHAACQDPRGDTALRVYVALRTGFQAWDLATCNGCPARTVHGSYTAGSGGGGG